MSKEKDKKEERTYTVEELNDLMENIREGLAMRDDPCHGLREVVMEAVPIYKELTRDAVENMEAKELKKWKRRYFNLKYCGQWMSRFKPATGGYTSFKNTCDDFVNCPKCRARKAQMEAQALEVRTNTSDNKKTVIMRLQDSAAYKALQAKLYRDDDNDVLRRYEFEDGTVEVWLDKDVDYTNGVLDREDFYGYLDSSAIAERLERIKPGSRLSGSVKSERVAMSFREDEDEKQDKEEQEPEEEKEKIDYDSLSDVEKFELIQELNKKDENDSIKVFSKILALKLDCPDEISNEIRYEALRNTYLDTFDLNPDLEDVQFALNMRQDAYVKHIKEIATCRGISILHCEYNTHVETVTRKNVDWKGYFVRFVVKQFKLDSELIEKIPPK